MFGVDPTEVYVSDSRRGGTVYHTSTDCPDLPPATEALTPDDPEYEDVLERDECQWCRYETLELELPDDEEA